MLALACSRVRKDTAVLGHPIASPGSLGLLHWHWYDPTKFRTIWGHRVAAALWHRPWRAQASSLKPGTRQGMSEKLCPAAGRAKSIEHPPGVCVLYVIFTLRVCLNKTHDETNETRNDNETDTNETNTNTTRKRNEHVKDT